MKRIAVLLTSLAVAGLLAAPVSAKSSAKASATIALDPASTLTASGSRTVYCVLYPLGNISDYSSACAIFRVSVAGLSGGEFPVLRTTCAPSDEQGPEIDTTYTLGSTPPVPPVWYIQLFPTASPTTCTSQLWFEQDSNSNRGVRLYWYAVSNIVTFTIT